MLEKTFANQDPVAALRLRARMLDELASTFDDSDRRERMRRLSDRFRAEADGLEGSKRLDKFTLDEIAKELRAEYRHAEPKPQYLGDRALPADFERYLAAIERVEQIRAAAVSAVGDALEADKL
jgi:hypothetical protein